MKVLGLLLGGDFKDEEFQKIKEFLSSEYIRIKIAFRRTVLRPRGEAYFTEYFGLHQIALVELLDKIFETRIEMSSRADQFSSVLEFLLKLNGNILSIIKNEFSTFFLDSINAPKWIIEQAQQDLAVKIDALQLIGTNQYVESELINPVLSVFHEIPGKPGCSTLTFKKLDYLKLLQAEVFQIDFSIDDVNWRRMNLCNVLIRVNFNDPQFFKFYTDHINRALLNCETLSDRIDQAAYYYKIISQIAVIHGVGVNDDGLNVKRQLLEWISCELDYLHQKERLQLFSKTDGQVKSDFKMIFDLSVSQLAYIFKIFIDTDIIQNKNISEVIRFLSKFVKTKRAESVSYESLRIKFYNAESGAKDAVKKTFQSLLSYINKN